MTIKSKNLYITLCLLSPGWLYYKIARDYVIALRKGKNRYQSYLNYKYGTKKEYFVHTA